MNRNIRLIFVLLFSVLLIFCLSACRSDEEPAYEPESAVALWEKVDQTMNTLESMELDTTTKVVFFNGGYQFELRGTAKVLSTKEAHYTESINVVSCAELSMEQTTRTVEAYYDGRVYIANINDTYTQKLCSEMTHEEYDQIQGGELTDEIEFTNCTSAEFSKGEAEMWNLTFSGYTKETIDKVLETLMLTDDVLGAPVSDMEVRLTANCKFYVETMEIVFIFTAEEGQKMPEFAVTAEYSGYNTAVFDPAKLKAEEYTPVTDVRLMETVANAIKARQEALMGKFTLDITNTYEYAGVTQTSAESDTVTYGRKNGAYTYLITAIMDGQSLVLQYQSGQQTITAGDQTHIAAQTDAEARSFISSLIDSARFNVNAVTDIQNTEEGVYTLTCAQLDLRDYTEALTGNNIQLTSGNQQITVTFLEDKLMKIESSITLIGTNAGEHMSMVTASVVTFDDSEQTV